MTVCQNQLLVLPVWKCLAKKKNKESSVRLFSRVGFGYHAVWSVGKISSMLLYVHRNRKD